LVTSILHDLRDAWRAIRKSPATSLVIVLTLALGLGANVAIFSVINGVILRPLPYPEPDELVLATSRFPAMGFDRFWISPPEYFELSEWSSTLDAIGGYRAGDVSIVGAEQPVRVRAGFATATLFDVLGVPAAQGRFFSHEEDLPNAAPVVVLSHELWTNLFGARADLVGSSLLVNGQPATVVGVMPPRFDIEDNGIQAWIPLNLDPAQRTGNRGNHFLYLVARLAEGASLDAARTELATLVEGWNERIGDGHTPSLDNHPLQIEPLLEEMVGDVRPALLALLGAVAFVLLIACANVANVMLARSEARRKELAIRTSMGASRARLVRLMLGESLCLALLGGGLGVAVGSIGLRVLLRLSPDSLPRTGDVELDGRVLVFALLLSLLTGLIFGLAPAFQVRLHGLVGLLKEGALRASGGAAGLASRRALVVVEMALAVGLVVGAGLMLRSLDRLLAVDTGFASEGLVTFELFLPPASYPDPAAQGAFLERLFGRLGEEPGVVSVAAASGLPPQRDVNANDMDFEGLEQGEDAPIQNVDYWQFVTPDYLEAMKIRVREGRGFEPGDDAAATPVALVNQRLVDVFYPGQSALGRRLRPPGDGIPWFTIVGVVEDVKQGGLDQQTGTEVYWSYPQVGAVVGFAPRTMNVVVRAASDPDDLQPKLRAAVWELDRALPVAKLRTMERVVSESVARARFLTLLLSIFAVLAWALAAIGIYGVMSYAVAERSREMGIRMALGADRAKILGMVLSQGMVLAAVGLGAGTLAALALARMLRSLLFEVGAADPATYVAVLALLATVALLACILPALRATRVSPLQVLRSE
jgi:predicted permease